MIFLSDGYDFDLCIQAPEYIHRGCVEVVVPTAVQNLLRFRFVRSERSILRHQIFRPLLAALVRSVAIPKKSQLTVLGSPPKDPYII